MSTSTLIEPAWVWLRRLSLDRRLAHGADPATDKRLARRARQLTSPRCRTGLAEGIRNVLDAAEEPRVRLTSAVPLQRREILRESPLLLAIARDLEGDEQLSARGVAMVEELLRDGDSPLYAPSAEGRLHATLTHTRAALLLD
jgi:hypothetical protein